MTRNKSRNFRAAAVGLGLLTLAAAATSPAASLTYTGSLMYSTGRYIFTQRTQSLYLYNGITAMTGALSVSLSVPVIHQNTPWISLTGTGLIPSGGTQHGSVHQGMHGGSGGHMALVDTTQYTKLGLGDPLVHVDLEIVPEKRILPSVKLTGDAKPPLASTTHGFGTGKWDYAGGLSLTKTFGTTYLFLDASYWELGNLPDQEFHNPLAYGVALGHAFGEGKYSALLSLSGDTRIQDNVDPPLQVNAAGSCRVSGRVNLSANLGVGLTESSPDFVGGLGWRVAL